MLADTPDRSPSETPSPSGAPPPSGTRRSIELAFGLMALVSLLLGFALYLFGEWLGLDETTGRLVATAFIVAGALDTAVLYFWDRLFSPHHRP